MIDIAAAVAAEPNDAPPTACLPRTRRRYGRQQVRGGPAKRVEQLANNFASVLLMPSDAVRTAWDMRSEIPLVDRIVVTADEFKVSAPAMKWRLRTSASSRAK